MSSGPTAIAKKDDFDLSPASLALGMGSVAAPHECPKEWKAGTDKIGDELKSFYRDFSVPWMVQWRLSNSGFTAATDIALRWPDDAALHEKASRDCGFFPGQNGYDEDSSLLAMIRLSNVVERCKTYRKRKLTEVDTTPLDDHKAMLGRGDRAEMRNSYKTLYHIAPETSFEGSEHYLGVLKRVLTRGEFPTGSQLDLSSIVPHHPLEGELKFQKRKSKDDNEWNEESAHDPVVEKSWRRTMMIWRTSLLMACSVCPHVGTVDLTKDKLDKFYDFLYGETIMTREPAPSLSVMKVAERKAWRRVALLMSKDDTMKLSEALLDITRDSNFWVREVYEFCKRGKGDSSPWKPSTTKPKGVAKGYQKAGGKAWMGGGKPTAPGKSKKGKGGKGKPPPAWGGTPYAAAPAAPAQPATRQWASTHTDGSQFCKKYHAFNNCPGSCGRCHLCPILLPGGNPCGANHRASVHP
jgi:hypothetical protein